MADCHSDCLQRSKKKSLIQFLALILFLFTIVMPNSFPFITGGLLVFCSVVFIHKMKIKELNLRFLKALALMSFVTVCYIIIGMISGAPRVAAFHVCIIYIISPVLWTIIIASLLKNLGISEITKLILISACLCVLSIVIFFILYDIYGSRAVSVFRENANVSFKNGYFAATLHVYGSLIFITGAVFSAPEVIPKNVRAILLISILVCVITSGRDALLLSIPIGVIINFLSPKSNTKTHRNRLSQFILFVLVLTVVCIALPFFLGIDIALIIDVLMAKVLGGGGEERLLQTVELFKGIKETLGLGAGHGIGVSYVRSYEFPWRYENVWIATIFRVGIVGFLIYSIPFILYFICYARDFFRFRISEYDRFMFGGFMCAFLSSCTNPYLEAVSFQWMYIMPILCYFIKIDKVQNNSNNIKLSKN